MQGAKRPGDQSVINPPTPDRGDQIESLLPQAAWVGLSKLLGLSPREVQIVRAVLNDDKQETIAANLGISPFTVNTYFQRLYLKLQVGSRPQLIVRVLSAYRVSTQSE